MTPILDAMGREIKPNQTVVYAAADGRSAVLRRGTVIDVYWTLDDDGSEEFPRVTVDAQRYRYYGKTWVDQDRLVTLKFPHRIAVLDTSASK